MQSTIFYRGEAGNNGTYYLSYESDLSVVKVYHLGTQLFDVVLLILWQVDSHAYRINDVAQMQYLLCGGSD